MNALTAIQPELSLSLGDWLADLAVDALIDEADLSPKPGLVDRRGSGAHTDLHLGLMHASALALWPSFKAMAEAAQQRGEINLHLREDLGRIGREGEVEMLRVTGGVNTHRGAIWALGLLSAAAALEPRELAAEQVAVRAARLALLNDRAAPVTGDSHGAQVCRLYGVHGAREEAQLGFPAVIQQALPQLARSRAAGAGEQNARLDDPVGRHLRALPRRYGRTDLHAERCSRGARCRRLRQPRRPSPFARPRTRHAAPARLAWRRGRSARRHPVPRPPAA